MCSSDLSNLRDSVPATLPQLLRYYCLHAPPPLGSPLANPTTRYSPARNCTTASAGNAQLHQRICRQSQASAHSAAAADAHSVRLRSSDVSCVILERLGASDASPSSPKSLPARTTAPLLAACNPPPPATGPRATARAHTHTQAPGHSASPSDARSVLLRSSDVSCVILPILSRLRHFVIHRARRPTN